MSKFMKFWLLIICFLFIFLIIFTDRVKADTIKFNAQNITYSAYNVGYTAGNVCSNGHCNISGNSFIVQNIDIKFKPNQYYNLPNYLLIFSINSVATSGNMTITANAVTDDNYNTIGTCESYTNSTGQITQLTAICKLSDLTGLKNGNNILRLGVSSVYSNNSLVFTILMNPTVYMTTSSTCDKTCMTSIANTINLNNNTNTNSIINAINSLNTSNNNIINAIDNQNTQQHNDAQQQYNYISNTTISNENYTNTQTISDNNTNTQTKSVVMNFWLIPLNFFNSIIASFENTCTQVCIGECGSGHDNAWRFIFPCLDIKGFVGNTIYNTIDAFFAVGMIFAFVKRAKNFFINALMLTNDVASEVSVF